MGVLGGASNGEDRGGGCGLGGTSQPIYEKYILGMLGIERLNDAKRVPSN